MNRRSTLWTAAVAVASYAQLGRQDRQFGEELPDPDHALTVLITALYVPIGSKHQAEDFDELTGALGGGTRRMSVPLEHPVNAILAAAVARLQIECHQPTNPTQLALLASVSEDTVRADVRKGLLESEGVRPKLISAESARRWLASRGVAGYELRHKVVQTDDGEWVGLVFSPWHQEWGRVTKRYPTERRAQNALLRALEPDAAGAVFGWVDDPEGLGWRVPELRSRLRSEIALT